MCLIKARPQSQELLQALSGADTSVYGWATLVSQRSRNGMQRILIPLIPAFYINQSELVLSHYQNLGEIRVVGVDRVLEKLEVCEGMNQNRTDWEFESRDFPFLSKGKSVPNINHQNIFLNQVESLSLFPCQLGFQSLTPMLTVTAFTTRLYFS